MQGWLELHWGKAGSIHLRLFLIGEVLGASQAEHCYPVRVRLVFISDHFDVEFKMLFCLNFFYWLLEV